MFHLGFGVYPDRQGERIDRLIVENKDPNRLHMVSYDDFNRHATAHVLTRDDTMHHHADITNIISKEVTETGIDLHRREGVPLFPPAFTFELARPWFEQHWTHASLAHPSAACCARMTRSGFRHQAAP